MSERHEFLERNRTLDTLWGLWMLESDKVAKRCYADAFCSVRMLSFHNEKSIKTVLEE